MAGRLFVATALASSILAAGCRSTPQTAGAPAPAQTSSRLSRILGTSPPGPHNQVAPVEATAKENNGPIKSETVAIFADLTVDAAFNNENLTPQERDNRIDDARQRFERALAQDPKNLETLRGLGRLYTRLGDRDRAAQIYQSAMKHHPKSHILAHEAALSNGRFEDWQTALALWEHALALDPANRKYPRMIGLAQARLGNYDAGYTALANTLPEAEARTIMARILMDNGQSDAARQQAELAVKADPTFMPAREFLGVQPAGFQQP